jgi:hypothetical protein
LKNYNHSKLTILIKKDFVSPDDVDSLAFGVRKTTTRLPVTNKATAATTTTTTSNNDQFSEDELDEALEDDDEVEPIQIEPIIDTSGIKTI